MPRPEAYWAMTVASAAPAPVQPQHEPEVQGDVQRGGHRQKDQGDHGIAHRPQEGGEVIVKEGGGDAAENDGEVFPHHGPHRLRHLEEHLDPVQAQEGGGVEDGRQGGDEDKGGVGPLPQAVPIPLAEADGEHRPAAHAQAQQDGGEEGHEGEGGAHRRQGVLAQIPAHNQGIRDIIALLEQVAQDHGDGEAQHGAHHRTLGEIPVHDIPSLSS